MSVRRVNGWAGFTNPSEVETAHAITGTDIIGIGLVVDLSTNTVRISDGRTDYTDLPTMVSDVGFDAAVRLNRVDQMAVPTSDMAWPSSSVTAGGVGAATASAGDGAVLALAASALGGGILIIKSNSGHAQGRVTLGTGGLSLGPGGSTAPDVILARTGTAAGTLTGALTISAGLTVSAGSVAFPAGSVALVALATDPLARANHTGTQTASTVSDFDTQVRTNRIDQMTAPNTALSWPVGFTVTGLATASGTAGDGQVILTESSFLGGGFVALYGNTADTQPKTSMSGVGFSVGPGGSTAADFTVQRTGTGAASITVTTLTLAANMVMSGRTISTGTGTGLIIGTGPTQKVGLYGTAAVVQPSGAAQAAVVTTAATQTTPWGYSTQAQADGIITLLNAMRSAMVALGSMKGAA